jgi:uncharacterized cupin superfamily protein
MAPLSDPTGARLQRRSDLGVRLFGLEHGELPEHASCPRRGPLSRGTRLAVGVVMAALSPWHLMRFVRRSSHHRGIQTIKSACGTLLPRPIDSSCIEEGTPLARCATFAESPDRRLSSGLWECSAGKFKVVFTLDEVVHIVEGGVAVREGDDGPIHELGPGDAAYFPLGLVTHWHVPRYVKKFFVVRVPGGNPSVARIRQRFAV